MASRRRALLMTSVVAMLLSAASLLGETSGFDGALLFYDDFEDGAANDLNLAPGWEVLREADGNHVASGEGRGQWAILDQGKDWTDYVVRFRLKLLAGGFQLNFRLSNPHGLRTRYWVTLYKNTAGIGKEYPPYTYANLEWTATGIPFPLNVWHDIEIRAIKGHLQVLVDGWMALEHFDPDPLLNGGIALEVRDDPPGSGMGSSLALVDNVEVRATVHSAHEPTWVRTGGPHGGLGYDVRMRPDNPDIMYVTDSFAGVHISTDGGLNWLPSNEGITARSGVTGDLIPIFSLTIDPHDPDIIWVGTQNAAQIYKSTDGGRTWDEMGNGVDSEWGISFRGFTVDPRSSSVVYAAAEVASWLWAGEELVGRQFDLTKGVVYKTTDGGRNWRAIWRGDNLARYVWVDPRDSDVIYVSTGIFDREAANSDPGRGIPGGEGILKSTDGGVTWTHANDGLENLYVGSLFMHPENPDILLAGTGNTTYFEGQGVYLSTDGGSSWELMMQEPGPGFNITSVEFSLSDPDIAYAGSNNGFFRSEDGGHTWESTSEIWGAPQVRGGIPIDVEVDPRDPDRLFANAYMGGNFLSIDGGLSWTVASKGYTGAQVNDIAVDPTNAGRVLAAARSGLFVSSDSGDGWTGLCRDFLEWMIVAVSPVNPQWLITSDDWSRALNLSVNGGETWRVVMHPPGESVGWRAVCFAPSEPRTVFAGTASFISSGAFEDRLPAQGIYVSHDGGMSWNSANDSVSEDAQVTALAVSYQDPKLVYAATGNHGLLKSASSGESWTPINQGLPESLVPLSVACHPTYPGLLLVGLDCGGTYRSIDGGVSWQSSSAGMNPEATITDIVFDPTNPNVVYVSDQMSGVYRSPDGGETWHAINAGLRMREVSALALSSDGQVLYAATWGEGVYRLDLRGFGVPLDPQDRDGDGVPDE